MFITANNKFVLNFHSTNHIQQPLYTFVTSHTKFLNTMYLHHI